MSDEDDLAALDAEYEQAVPPERKPMDGEIPDGKYTVKIEKAFLEKFNGTQRLKIWLRIIEGPYMKHVLFYDNSIVADRLKYLKNDLYTCGVREGVTPGFAKFSDLPKILPTLIDVYLEVASVTNKDNPKYKNVYINKKITIPF